METRRIKTGGRQKGTPNKTSKSSKNVVRELLASMPGSDPFLLMAGIVADPLKEDDLRLSAAKELAKYTEPQLKSVEVSAQIEGSVVIGAMVPHFNGPQPPTEKLIDESTISFL